MYKYKAIKIVCEIYGELSSALLSSLKEIGVKNMNIHNGRSVSLIEKSSRIFSNLITTKMEESPFDIYEFYVNEEDELKVIKYIIKKNELFIPGRGSVYSIKIDIITNEDKSNINKINITQTDDLVPYLTKLVGIRCIVQKGNSLTAIKTALSVGSSVPIVSNGEGAGLRDKLGLLRIAISADKEIVNIVVNENDADEIMNILIQTAKIYDVGKGFIYTYPINKGLVNTKIYRGRQKYAASVDQIISAIDHLKGNSDWRRKFSKIDRYSYSDKINILTNLIDINFNCNEGAAMDVIQSVLRTGGTGATIGKIKSYFEDDGDENLYPARETSYMTIPENHKDKIIASLISAGIFLPQSSGVIEIIKVGKASTYKKPS